MNDSLHYTAAVAAQTRERIAQAPLTRQAVVARHYASLARTAVTMLEITQRLQYHMPTGDTPATEMLNRCEADIAKAHFDAFGVWPTWWLAHEGHAL